MLLIWTTGLLFSMTSLGGACILGIFGKSAVLPCFYGRTFDLDSGNVSIEWRTGSEPVHVSVLGKAGETVEFLSQGDRMRLIMDTIQDGDVSLLISDITVRDAQSYDCYLTQPGVQSSTHLCTVCLSTAAHFTQPVVQRADEAKEEGEEAHFICHSRGGFPEPTVHWLSGDRERPLVGTVRTYSSLLPHSELYNITSVLSVNITRDMKVSCAVENHLLNETLTSSSFEVQASPAVARASEALWMYSTALCVIVGILVVSAVVYQVKQDYDRKRKNQREYWEFGGKKSKTRDDRQRIIWERLNSLTETTV
ncbi:hypothetical protein GJAV_G00209850 [Gymnothorax javanicus]|nr:hypothetical protein GJAV_G00209850 [Gymnothorax javanicus]